MGWAPVDVGRFLISIGPGNERWFDLGVLAREKRVTGRMLIDNSKAPGHLQKLFSGLNPPLGRAMAQVILTNLHTHTRKSPPNKQKSVAELEEELKAAHANIAALHAENTALRLINEHAEEKLRVREVKADPFGVHSILDNDLLLGEMDSTSDRASPLGQQARIRHDHTRNLDDSIIAADVFNAEEFDSVLGSNSAENILTFIENKTHAHGKGKVSTSNGTKGNSKGGGSKQKSKKSTPAPHAGRERTTRPILSSDTLKLVPEPKLLAPVSPLTASAKMRMAGLRGGAAAKLLEPPKRTPVAMTQKAFPVYEAAQENDVSALRKLLASKANVDEIEPESGATPVSIAAEMNHVECLNLLIKVRNTAHPRARYLGHCHLTRVVRVVFYVCRQGPTSILRQPRAARHRHSSLHVRTACKVWRSSSR